MDVLFFLKKRTNFIRQFYETAGQPFRGLAEFRRRNLFEDGA